MGRILSNVYAIIRGLFIKAEQRLLKRNNIGKKFRVFGSTIIRARNGGRVIIGDNVKVSEDTVISVLNGGLLEIGDNVGIGRDCDIVCHNKISIGNGTLLAPRVMIFDHDHVFDKETGIHRKEFNTAEVAIGENSWIGANVVILRGTKIGNNCVVGAGSIVKGQFPDCSVIVQKRQTDVIEIA